MTALATRPTTQRGALGAQVAIAALAVGIAVPVYRSGQLTLATALMMTILAPPIAGTIIRDRTLQKIWLLVGLWVGAQLVSDIWHGTKILSTISLAAVAAGMLASGLVWILDQTRVKPAHITAAVGLGMIVLELALGEAALRGNLWKYGLAPGVATFVLSLAYARDWSRRAVELILVALAATSLVFDSRAYAAMFLFAAGWLVVSGRPKRDRRVGRYVAAGLVAVVGLYLLYPAMAERGYLGDRAQTQQLAISAAGTNFVLYNRPEAVQIAYLVAHHPVLGIGTEARLTPAQSGETIAFVDRIAGPLDPLQKTRLRGGTLGSVGYVEHTQSLASALHAGVLALLFWAWFLIRMGRIVVRVPSGRIPMPGLTTFAFAMMTWDALFSPFHTRVHLMLGVALFLLVISSRAAGLDGASDDADQDAGAFTP